MFSLLWIRNDSVRIQLFRSFRIRILPFNKSGQTKYRNWQILIAHNARKTCFGFHPDSVPDPDPDPHVFGPSGSGSTTVVRGMDPDPDPSIIMQK